MIKFGPLIARRLEKRQPTPSPRRHLDDADLYKERNRVELFFSRIKHFRRIANRYDKLASTFRGFITFAAIMLWLK